MENINFNMTSFKNRIGLSLFFVLIVQIIVCSQVTETIKYDSGFDNLFPKKIIEAIDYGYIINGSVNNHEFIMRVESQYNIEWNRQVFELPRANNYYAESILPHSDSSYLFFSPYNQAGSSYDQLSIVEMGNDGGFISKKLIDFGVNVSPVNAIKKSNNETIIALNGNVNFLLCIDSMGYPKWVKKYSNSEFSLFKIEYLTDSTTILLGRSFSDFVIMEVDDIGNINWQKYIEIPDWPSESMDVIYQNDTIYTLINTQSNSCYLTAFDSEGKYLYNHGFGYSMDYFNYIQKLGIVNIDSSGFTFYSGNSLIQSDYNGTIIKEIGQYVSFQHIYTKDSLFLLAIKNGFTPVLSNNTVKDGAEFVVLVGENLNNIFDEYTLCMSNDSYGFNIEDLDLTPDNADIQVDTLEVLIQDSVTLINAFTITNSIGCPEAPNSIQQSTINNIKLYPQPAMDILKIEIEDHIDCIHIYDMNGSKVYTTEIIDQSSKVISLETLSTGFYILTIESNGMISSHKLIVQK